MYIQLKKNEQGLNHLKHDFLSSTCISYIELSTRPIKWEKQKRLNTLYKITKSEVFKYTGTIRLDRIYFWKWHKENDF